MHVKVIHAEVKEECGWPRMWKELLGRGIRVGNERVGQFHAELVARVQRSRFDDQPLGEFEVDVPVARFVGIGQRRACHRFGNAHVVELACLSGQADLNIAQALAVGKLRESHDAKLIGTTQGSYSEISAVSIHDVMEGSLEQKIHDLREQSLANVNWCEPLTKARRLAKTGKHRSNRAPPNCLETRVSIGFQTDTPLVNWTVLC